MTVIAIEAFLDELRESLPGLDDVRLTPESEFRALEGWDSLATLSTLAVFDSSFGTQLSPIELVGCRTLRDIYDLGAKRAGAAG